MSEKDKPKQDLHQRLLKQKWLESFIPDLYQQLLLATRRC